MNRFLVYPVPDFGVLFPGRLYARLDDAIEVFGSGKMHLRLGCVDAVWFDANQSQVVGTTKSVRRQALEQMPVHFLELDLPAGGEPPTFGWSGHRYGYEDWLEIWLEPGANALLYQNLFSDGLPVAIRSLAGASPSTTAALEEAHNPDEWVEEDDEIEKMLKKAVKAAVESIGVYDVGQGTCVGLNANRAPILYFDFGGGTAAHKTTRYHKIPSLCLCKDPIFVLSHWDADHWSSAALVTAALASDWIAPYQTMTPPQIVFAGTITGRLAISKAAAGTKFVVSNAEVHRASGAWSDRNNSGFFLVVQGPSQSEPFLFPGDADYTYLTTMPSTAAGLAATHHGGNWSSAASPPKAAGGGPNRVVFSFGIFSATKANSYGHPTATSRGDHATSGYAGLDTPLRVGGASLNGTGHVYLDWSGSTPSPPKAPCGSGACYQNFDQA